MPEPISIPPTDTPPAPENPPVVPPKEDTPPVNPPKEENPMVPHGQFHAERERRKEAEAELTKLKAEAEERAKKEAEEKGEFEKLYKETEAKLLEKDELLKKATERLTLVEQAQKAEIDTQMSKLDAETKALVESLISGKEIEEQASLVPKLIAKFTQPQTINPPISPEGKATPPGKREELEAAFQEAKKAGNINLMLKLQTEIDNTK